MKILNSNNSLEQDDNVNFLKLTDYNYPKFYVINKKGIISSYEASSFQERTIDKFSIDY